MSKHTPGPWGWHTPATTSARHPCYVTAGNQYIAAIYHGENQMETHPNARLIAAAPDLLEALQNLSIVMQELHNHWDNDRDMKVGKGLLALSGLLPGYDKRIDVIHAAIARAEATNV